MTKQTMDGEHTPPGMEVAIPEEMPVAVRDPKGVVDFAQEAAKMLMDIVESRGLAKAFKRGAKPHIFYEGWATVARFYNCTIRAGKAHPVGEADSNYRYPGFKASAELVDKDGMVVGSATAYCMRDEKNWRTRDNYALASMAQTRAGSKAARMVLSWVVVLAGYSATPAEEMDGIHDIDEADMYTDGGGGKDRVPNPAPAKYAEGSQKRFLEAWIKEHCDNDRESVKMWLYQMGKCGENDDGIPTLNKADAGMVARIYKNPEGAALNYKTFLTELHLGGDDA